MKTFYSFMCSLLLTATTNALANTEASNSNDLIFTLDGPFTVKTANDDYFMKIGGNMQWDYNNTQLNNESNEDDIDIRRSRVNIVGKVQDWSYIIQFNVSNTIGGTPDVVFIDYNGWGEKAVIRVGNQPEPFGLQQILSPKSNSFLERSSMDEKYSTFLNEGIQLSGVIGKGTYAIGLFEDDSDGNGSAVTGRVTYAPILSDNQVLHLAAAYSDRSQNIKSTGLELGYVRNEYHFQSEYFFSDNDGLNEEGYYAQAGWVITGEVRPYSKGVFNRILPNNSSGAWELIARYENGDGDFSDAELGDTSATSYGIGVNYYANNYVRIAVNYNEAEDKVTGDTGSELRARLELWL